jgi:hypothetical protein
MRLILLKKYSALFFLVSLCSLQGLYAQSSDGKASATDVTMATISDDRYKISYPDTWKADQSGARGTAFLLYLPSVGDNTTFKDNINLLIQDLTGYDMDLKGFTELSMQQLNQMLPEIKILTNDLKNADGHDFHQLVFTAKQSGFNLKFEQRYWVKNNTAYVVTATYTEKTAAEQEPGIKIVLDSFQPVFKK